jgi:deoxyribonuclease V
MSPDIQHEWDLIPGDAIALQKKLAIKIILQDEFEDINYIAGIDAGFKNSGRVTNAAICIFNARTLQQVEQVTAQRKTQFPYIPGLLSFREIPAILDAFGKLTIKPDLLLCDGQGTAHPRRFGIACHLGLLLNIPSIGIGKSRLIGTHQPVPVKRGAWVKLYHKNEIIGAVLRTRTGIKPVYVSPGHRICRETAIDWVLKTAIRYKLPEPIRAADKLASS